ncbi:MAG: cytochrome P450 [Dehalococcoidia bacterium]
MTSTQPDPAVEAPAPINAPGRNGVEVKRLGGRGGYYRTYEIYGRVRERHSQHLVNPRWFLRLDYLRDPYPALAIMRENYDCYRDWINNAHWVSRYNDVTSILVDDANFETRPKRWSLDMEGYGRDLREEPGVLRAWATGMERAAEPVAASLVAKVRREGHADLIGDFVYRYWPSLLASALDLPPGHRDRFITLYHTMMDGWQWDPARQAAAREAMRGLESLVAPLVAERAAAPGDDVISAIAAVPRESQASAAADVVATILEGDGETPFAVGNTLYQVLTSPGMVETVRGDHGLCKRAWQETVRHSGPTLQGRRFAVREVERFGHLIPEGGLVWCSAAGANRDPRQFDAPETFNIFRRDLCFREPRGQYRADGLPAGVAIGLGKPSKLPAVPEDRPRSLYAITRDISVAAIELLLDQLPGLRLAEGAEPRLFCRWAWDIHTCWDLPVVFDRA